MTDLVLSLNAHNWDSLSGGKIYNAPSGYLYTDFPVVRDRTVSNKRLNYLTTDRGLASIADKQSLSVTLEIVTTGTPEFNYKFDPNNTCDVPCSVRPYFAKTGGLTSGNEFDRWWSNPISYTLAAGSTTLVVPLTGDAWSSVYGKFGNASPEAIAGFEAAKADLGNIGLTFGGGCFFGHGVNVLNGTAQFRLNEYRLI